MAKKLIFLWHPGEAGPHLAFAERARLELRRRFGGSDARQVLLHVTVLPPPRLSLVPFLRRPVAMVSVWGEGEASALARRMMDRLEGLDGDVVGYEVDEAVPVARPAASVPGACLLTLLRRNPGLDREAFFKEWFGRHTPMSLEIHPLMGYVRNQVLKALLPGSPPWDGIVTEDFRLAADLLNPLRLFGGPLRALPNMARVGLHIHKFLDLGTLENYLVTEFSL
jgi:hypothetical protein